MAKNHDTISQREGGLKVFHIVVNQLEQCYYAAEDERDRRWSLMIETQHVLRAINELTDMDDIKAALSKQITRLETEHKQYSELLQALELVLAYYNTCEKRIVAQGEIGSSWTFKVTFKENDFTNLFDDMKEMQ